MTAVQNAPTLTPAGAAPLHRDSWVPTPAMIATRFMELRRRRGLMITLAVVLIGLPSLFLGIRLILHATDPKSYGPAGGTDIFTGLVAGVIFVFGFIVAATLGVTAGSSDLTDGMFRHLVVTGRERVALYFARIPAGLAIIVPMMAVGFTIVCAVCSFAAPTTISFEGVQAPAHLSEPAFVAWAVDHKDQVVCQLNINVNRQLSKIPIPCGPNGLVQKAPGPQPTAAQLRELAVAAAEQNYAYYSKFFLSPPISLMVESGLWLLLEAAIGFLVGLGLGSLIGQRTVAVIIMVVLEIVLTPLFATAHIPYLINLQRAVVGIATAHLEPNGLTHVFGAGGGPNGGKSNLIPETTLVSSLVVAAWIVVWTAIGAWRMRTRDA